MLRPDKKIQKLLISSTSKFVGEYESDSFLITHAFPLSNTAIATTSLTENPHCRNYYVVVVNTASSNEDSDQEETYFQYDWLGDFICIYMSILFGKRFDYHGLFETNGLFSLVNIADDKPLRYPSMPINNHKPRTDLEIPLTLNCVSLLEPLLVGKLDPKVISTANAAGKFYLRSIRLFEEDQEIAFLDLITCGEVLSNFYNYNEDDLYDDELKALLKTISKDLKDGSTICKHLKSRLFQVRRRYTMTLMKLLNSYFFEHSESLAKAGKLCVDDIEKRIKASYDLRSLYVHEGIRIGSWLDPITNLMNEVQIGIPVIESKSLQKLMTITPTYLGLERIIRFCLLRFLHTEGLHIDDRLN